MRQITREAVDAFMNGYCYKKSNMMVTCGKMYLHGNKIAWFDINKKLWIDTCGYHTNTTKERLNALPGVHVKTKNHQLYLNGVYWDGHAKNLGRVY